MLKLKHFIVITYKYQINHKFLNHVNFFKYLKVHNFSLEVFKMILCTCEYVTTKVNPMKTSTSLS